MKKLPAIGIFLLLLRSGFCFAQAVQDTSQSHIIETAQASAPSKTALVSRVIAIQVVNANDYQKANASESKKVTVFPDNIVRFTITNPQAFLLTRPTDQANVVMYANGIELKGVCTGWFRNINRFAINSGQYPALKDTADIDIILRRNDTTQAAWNLFYSSGKSYLVNYADVNASIGWEGMSALEKGSKVNTIRVIYYYGWIFWLWLFLFLVIITVFLSLGFRTDALREKAKGPFSLSLTQLFFWTLLIVGAFIYTLVLTDAATAMNPSVLLLLGVSILTTGGAAAIDTTYKMKNPDVPDKPHVSFFRDILADGNTYNVQRIQIFTWNLVLGLYFIIYTILHKTMPVFSETLLFLAGFSSISYLGGKIPEHTEAKTQADKEKADLQKMTGKTVTKKA